MGVKARGGTKKKEEKEEKFLLCESIGHQPLWGRCPKRGLTTGITTTLASGITTTSAKGISTATATTTKIPSDKRSTGNDNDTNRDNNK